MKISQKYLFRENMFDGQNLPLLADYFQRLFAFFIDLVVMSVFGIVIFFILQVFGMKLRGIRMKDFEDIFFGDLNFKEKSAFVIEIMSIFLPIIYFTLLTYFTNGFTVGKKICNIRVKAIYTSKISFGYSLERSLAYFADGITLGLGFLEILWKPNRMALHDRVSETVVIKVNKADQ